MKNCFLIVSVIYIHVFGQSQNAVTDTIVDTFTSVRSKPYEVAFACADINTTNELMFSTKDEPCLEILNGVLFRYKFRKLSLRFNASVFENESPSPMGYYVDGRIGKSNAKNFRIGAGLQWTPLLKKELVYMFIDYNYKSRKENSTTVDVITGSSNFQVTHARINGLDMIGGLGTKLRIYRSFYVSMEAGYNYFIAKNKRQTIQQSTRQSSIDIAPYCFDTLLLRLYLSLIF